MKTLYMIVNGRSITETEMRVTELFTMDWECQGGLTCDGHQFYQAMTLKPENQIAALVS